MALGAWMRAAGWPLGPLGPTELRHALTLRESLRTAAAAGADRNAVAAALGELDAVAAVADRR